VVHHLLRAASNVQQPSIGDVPAAMQQLEFSLCGSKGKFRGELEDWSIFVLILPASCPPNSPILGLAPGPRRALGP